MKRIILTFLAITAMSCNDVNEKYLLENEFLKKENDSLKLIVSEVSEKYVFDSISFREILSPSNTYELNSEVKGEIVIVGFNTNKKSRIIFVDSLSTSPQRNLHNPDTVYPLRGGYKYIKVLDKESIFIDAYIECDSEYGKNYSLGWRSGVFAN